MASDRAYFEAYYLVNTVMYEEATWDNCDARCRPLAKADRRDKKKFYHHFSIVKYSYLPKDTFKKLC